VNKEYAFEGHKAFQGRVYWDDAYKTLGDARRAAKQWIDRTPGKSAVLLEKEPRPSGHEIGATWRQVGSLTWTT
jgi:hypothetical protein